MVPHIDNPIVFVLYAPINKMYITYYPIIKLISQLRIVIELKSVIQNTYMTK